MWNFLSPTKGGLPMEDYFLKLTGEANDHA